MSNLVNLHSAMPGAEVESARPYGQGILSPSLQRGSGTPSEGESSKTQQQKAQSTQDKSYIQRNIGECTFLGSSRFREAFWSRVAIGAPNACWEWKGARNTEGYGRLRVRVRTAAAHRVAFELEHGFEIPKGFYACHRCDNPGCCNPVHIFLGTPADNVWDMVRKGRDAASLRRAEGKFWDGLRIASRDRQTATCDADSTDWAAVIGGRSPGQPFRSVVVPSRRVAGVVGGAL